MNTQTTKQVTTHELASILYNMPGDKENKTGTFAHVIQDTDARLLKRGNPYGTVRKQTDLSVLLNTGYTNGVHNQLKREGKDKSEYKPGINTMPLEMSPNNNFFGYFNGNPVIQYRPFDNSRPKVAYYSEADGEPLEKADIAQWIPKKSKPTTQGTDKEIFWRKLYVKNIVEITLHGVRYVNTDHGESKVVS